MKIYKGNLRITKENSGEYKDLVKVTGNLDISSGSNLEAPNLKSVGGDIYIYSNAKLDSLKSVGGYLYISSGSNLEAQNLKSVGGTLRIYSNANPQVPNLESIDGNLYIYSDANLEAPNLKSVGGNLDIYSDANLEATKLKSVGGTLRIYSNANLQAPNLESVGGYLSISSDSNLEALESVGGNLYIYSDANLQALESVGGYLYIYSTAIKNFPNNLNIKCFKEICGDVSKMKFESIDNIDCAVLSVKEKDGLVIKKCKRAVFKDGGLVGELFYVASNSKNNAHGKTIKEAIEELAFKEMSRDIEEYRGMSLDIKKNPKEWALVYRAITGACKLGVDMFMNDKGKLKKYYSLKQILEETKGNYGFDRFEEVVLGGNISSRHQCR